MINRPNQDTPPTPLQRDSALVSSPALKAAGHADTMPQHWEGRAAWSKLMAPLYGQGGRERQDFENK